MFTPALVARTSPQRERPQTVGGPAQGRRVRRLTMSAAVLGVLCWFWMPVPASARRLVIGRSVQGRPIVAWSLGPSSAPRKILVVGCIHGNECAGLRITRSLQHSTPPPGVQLWVVPEMNPDGTAADTRQNAHGVDLNRNFPYRWERITNPTYNSGPYPASEPETRAAMRFIRRIKPAVTIWYHQHDDLVDMSGGDRGVARRYAQVSGLRATCLPFLPGTATLWQNHSFPEPRHSWSSCQRVQWVLTR